MYIIIQIERNGDYVVALSDRDTVGVKTYPTKAEANEKIKSFNDNGVYKVLNISLPAASIKEARSKQKTARIKAQLNF